MANMKYSQNSLRLIGKKRSKVLIMYLSVIVILIDLSCFDGLSMTEYCRPEFIERRSLGQDTDFISDS